MNGTMIRSLGLASIAALTFACGGDRDDRGNATPRTARQIDALTALETANQNLRTALVGAAQAARFANDEDLLRDLASAGADCAATDTPPPGGDGSGTEPPPPATDCGPSLDFEADADDAAEELADRIFNASNVESSEATRVTLKLAPERICGSSGPMDPGTPAPELDPDCVAAFTDNPIRLTLESFAENELEVTILYGASRTTVASISLAPDEVAFELDLGGLKPALTNLLVALDGPADALPDTMTGRLRVALTKNAENDFTSTLSVVTAVRVAKSGDDTYDVSIGAASPAVTLRANGNTQQLTSAVSWGSIDVSVPLGAVFGSSSEPVSCWTDENGVTHCEEPPPAPELTGTVRLAMQALTGSAVMNASDDALTISDLGFGAGPVTATFDGLPLFSVDLNATAGRQVDVTMADAADGMSLKVSPELQLALGLDLASIADQVDDFPTWMNDDDLSLSLAGASSPEVVMLSQSDSETTGPGGEPPPPPTSTAVMRVAAGTLTLSSRAAGTSVSVTAGMCMLSNEPAEGSEPSHPIELMSSGACE
ncbi:hypothetical protein L6R52_20690 [Myxococcota bacterium]|nr:hypothetical protein [Myxococcota bacterium]